MVFLYIFCSCDLKVSFIRISRCVSTNSINSHFIFSFFISYFVVFQTKLLQFFQFPVFRLIINSFLCNRRQIFSNSFKTRPYQSKLITYHRRIKASCIFQVQTQYHLCEGETSDVLIWTPAVHLMLRMGFSVKKEISKQVQFSVFDSVYR